MSLTSTVGLLMIKYFEIVRNKEKVDFFLSNLNFLVGDSKNWRN